MYSSVLKFHPTNTAEHFLCIFPLGLDHLGRPIKLDGYAEESTIVLGCVFLQFRNHRATRLGHDVSQFRIRRTKAS